MATYKVIQDVEAEDKLIGPLTLRQFVYAGIAAVFLYLTYFVSSHGAGFLAAVFLPVVFSSAFFAFPWGRDQPTELWALAKIRFMLKPRKRTWDQDGMKELVTITVPKQVAKNYTNNLSQEEVRSRLKALASTIDTRGWAVKNANLNLYTQGGGVDNSDRLVAPSNLPKPVENTDIQAADDIMDENSNAGAQRLQSMIDKSSQEHHQKVVENLQKDQPEEPKPNYWFLNQPAAPANIPNDQVTFNTQVVTPGAAQNNYGLPASPAQDEASILADLEQRKMSTPTGAYFGNMHTIKPVSDQPQISDVQAAVAPPALPPIAPVPAVPAPAPAPPAAPLPQTAYPPVTPAQQTAILQLASNDDLNVATIAREAERSAPPDEVVIKLH